MTTSHRTHLIGPAGPYHVWHYACTCGHVSTTWLNIDTADAAAADHRHRAAKAMTEARRTAGRKTNR